jgi:SAM-dependent methyltransferase
MSSFGWEYAYHSEWGRLRRLFIMMFGIVDLPSRVRARAVLAALRDVSTESVLDVGAGTGVYAFYVTRDSNCRATAMDIDVKRIEMIRSIAGHLNRKGLSTVCGDEHALATLPAANFSLVLAIEVLQLFPDLKRVLRDLQERLRPGGVLIAHVPLRKSLPDFERHLLTDSILESLFEEAGFDRPEIRKTFGRAEMALCFAFASCISKPVLLACVYPLLLAATTLTPIFVDKGEFRLVIARKPFVTREHQ